MATRMILLAAMKREGDKGDILAQETLIELERLYKIEDAARGILARSLHEIKNLQDKLARRDPPGWEGEQRRALLVSDLTKTLVSGDGARG